MASLQEEGPPENRRVTCSQLPADFIVDKQEARKFFLQFGSIKNFYSVQSKQEYIVEFSALESVQKALSAQVNFVITPTKTEPPKSTEEFDPDVKAELESMLPIGGGGGSKPEAVKQTIENIIKNPSSMLFKSKLIATPKQQARQTEPISVGADYAQIQTAKSELENLARKPARTQEEKFAVLDARDKLYRLLTARPLDIQRATSTKGTCRDMCPEKERLMRVARMQVASFELDDNSEYMDPTKAIKQYSRSSADQEIPLPHELRPEEVLKTTMTYMLHKIMDLCDEEETSTGDWYHFVWDRTRGIRKDITQQELCSLTSVELLEQCARFHIHCSARLVAEEAGIFDQKINDENLTKSLQTLKYMYDDLKVKNIKCPNEAEFRAYVVLLNLNESGNFLWEIKRLEKDMLRSGEMQFALDVYFALALNNYVKFFNLVREATYMNACILMKYFTQVRLKALHIIFRSTSNYGRSKFKIEYLTKVLAFEDDEATVHFMQYHGSSCEDANTISLNFEKPELPFKMERSSLVESKKKDSVSMAICGGPLPAPDCFMDIQPHSSFDDNGLLKKGAFYAEDQNGPLPGKDIIFKVPRESPPISPKTPFQQKTAFKSDQPDGVSQSDVFAKSIGNNPFNNPLIGSPKSNVFGSPSVFGASVVTNQGSSSSSATTASSASPFLQSSVNNIFGTKSPAASSIGTGTLFGSSQGTVTNSPFGPQPIFATGSPKSVVSSNSSSSLKTSTSSGSSKYSSPHSSYGSQESQFETPQQKLERERETARIAEQMRIEEERIRRENEEAEERMRQRLQEKIRQESERREAERMRLEKEENRRREAEEAMQRKLQQDAENICESLIDEIVTSNVSHETRRAFKMYVELPRDFYDALEHDVVIEELINVYQQEHLSYINAMKRKYETMTKCFNQWRQTTAREINRRELLSNIGCPRMNKSLDEYALDISHPEQHLTLSNMKQYLSGSPQQITLPDLDSYKKIDLFQNLKFSQGKIPSKLFWKIIISVPMKNIEHSMSYACFMRKWLNKTFDVDSESEIFYLKRQAVHQLQKMMSICIRKVQGRDCINEKGAACPEAVKDANSLLFFCTTADLQESRKRLQNILSRLDNPIAVSIVIYKNVIEATDEDLLRQHMDLSSEPKVKMFEINLYYECHDKCKDFTEVVIESCQFLWDSYMSQLTNEYSKLFDMEMQHLLDFAQFYLGGEMWQRIELSCKDSTAFNNRMTSFNNIIQVFNACIDKTIDILSVDARTLPSLPGEFRTLLPTMEVRIPHTFEYFPDNWKTSLEQKNLAAFLRDLKLLPMDDDKFKDFQDFKEKLSAFLHQNLPSFKQHVFQAVVEKIIHDFYVMQLNGLKSVDEAISKMRWLHILDCIVIGKFNELYQQRKAVLPKYVIYRKQDLRSYLIPWWYAVDYNTSKDYALEPSKKKVKLAQKIDPQELQSALKKGIESLKKANEIITISRDNTVRTREDSKAFDQYLYKCEEQLRGLKRSLQSMEEKS